MAFDPHLFEVTENEGYRTSRCEYLIRRLHPSTALAYAFSIVSFNDDYFTAPYEFIAYLYILLLYSQFWLVIVLISVHNCTNHMFMNV